MIAFAATLDGKGARVAHRCGKKERESERAGMLAAIKRIDRNHANLRKSVVEVADDDRAGHEGIVAIVNAYERLNARVSRLEARMDFLLRHADGAVIVDG